MPHDKRKLLTAFGAAAVLAAVAAVPASANGSHGQSSLHSQSSAHSQKASHSKKGSESAKSSTSEKGAKSSDNQGSSTRGNSANAHEHVTICHATPPDTAANGYVQISPSAAGVYNGHLREHSADIIPPFTYDGQTYSANWDATGQAIWNNGCSAPAQTTETATTSAAVKGSEHGKSSEKSNSKANGKANGESGTQGNSANAATHVTICHATPPDTAANGYVEISPSASGVYHGHLREHSADIIPPFTYGGQTYSLNWDLAGQAIFANGCAVPALNTSLTLPGTKAAAKFVAAAKATAGAIVAVLANTPSASAKAGGVLAASKSKSSKAGGVLGARKTLKRVSRATRPARAVTRAASFTG